MDPFSSDDYNIRLSDPPKSSVSDLNHDKFDIGASPESQQPSSFKGSSEEMMQEEQKPQVKKEDEDEKSTFCYRSCPCCTLTYYKPFFDVDTKEVCQKFCRSFIPFSQKFNEICNEKPDFYGPFWICTTVVLSLGMCSEFNSWLQSKKNNQEFQWHASTIPVAMGMIYGGGILLPLILGLIMKGFGSTTSIGMVMTGYGYSYSVFIPVTFLCSIPNFIVQSLLLAYAGIVSAGFLTAIYWGQLKTLECLKKVIVMVLVVGFQTALVLVYKFYFFTYVV